MRKPSIVEMNAFVAIAERLSFAKAAAHVGVSRSTLSETIRGLEDKLGVRLFNRTTRSVALTEVGERLLEELRPALAGFEAAVESVNVFRDKPSGHLRLTVPRPAAQTVIAPVLAKFLAAYPAITLEIITDSALTDIVRGRFDAGIRPGRLVEKDMIAVQVGEGARPAVVASPAYFMRHSRPKVPGDLERHNCIRQRFASGAMHRWIFERRGKSLEVVVNGSLIISDGDLAVRAALDGVGVTRLPASSVETFVAQGQLVPVLEAGRPVRQDSFSTIRVGVRPRQLSGRSSTSSRCVRRKTAAGHPGEGASRLTRNTPDGLQEPRSAAEQRRAQRYTPFRGRGEAS